MNKCLTFRDSVYDFVNNIKYTLSTIMCVNNKIQK